MLFACTYNKEMKSIYPVGHVAALLCPTYARDLPAGWAKRSVPIIDPETDIAAFR